MKKNEKNSVTKNKKDEKLMRNQILEENKISVNN
jgi:hypothetical protein